MKGRFASLHWHFIGSADRSPPFLDFFTLGTCAVQMPNP